MEGYLLKLCCVYKVKLYYQIIKQIFLIRRRAKFCITLGLSFVNYNFTAY